MAEWAGEPVGPDVWETCRELIPAGSVFAFPAELPPRILVAAITLQALRGLSDFETVQELRSTCGGRPYAGSG